MNTVDSIKPHDRIYVRHTIAQVEPVAVNEQYSITVTGDYIEPFKEMVRRALNCWPDAHPVLKELGDMLMHGRILQDYYYTRTDKQKPASIASMEEDPKN